MREAILAHGIRILLRTNEVVLIAPNFLSNIGVHTKLLKIPILISTTDVAMVLGINRGVKPSFVILMHFHGASDKICGIRNKVLLAVHVPGLKFHGVIHRRVAQHPCPKSSDGMLVIFPVSGYVALGDLSQSGRAHGHIDIDDYQTVWDGSEEEVEMHQIFHDPQIVLRWANDHQAAMATAPRAPY